MNSYLPILCVVTSVLCSCATSSLPDIKPKTVQKGTEWIPHSLDPVPNIFGDKTKKNPVKNGFYEQDGTVASNASWESVAHYSFLGFCNIKIGIASQPYSISPSGRFVVVPKDYYHGAKKHLLKVYDKSLNRYILREVSPKVIREYKWNEDETTIEVYFEGSNQVTVLTIPRVPVTD